MGKAQSKRSVDITTEVKKDDVMEEGTGKMGKIEDVDQLKPQVNGDTHHNDTEGADKEKAAEADGTENEKDLSTEKDQPIIEPKTNLEAGDEAGTPTDNKPVENGNGTDETLNESKNPAETSTTTAENENGDSSKKPKKEKVKKKWSLRSISFGKKDKQKPSKKEEGTTNGECEKVLEEAGEEATKIGEGNVDESTAAVEDKSLASPAEEKADETKETAVVNGKSEPVKEEKPASEPTPDAPVVPAVVEEKKVEKEEPVSIVTEETQKTETDVADPNPTETIKSNEMEPVTAKIEVKAESIQDDNAHKSSEEENAHIQQEIKTEELIKNNNDDGDSESAQSLPPPPLPCTSPPSQVSVFALSDSKDQDQQLPPPTAEPIEVAQVLPATAELPAESVGSPAGIEISSSEIEVKAEETKQNTEVKSPMIESTEPTTLPAEIIESSTEVIQIANEIIATVVDAPVSDTPKDNKADEALTKVDTILQEAQHEGEINSEQIAQTIALIDQVTQEAVNISQNKVEESNSAISSYESETLKEQVENIKNIVTETSSNDPHPEENLISPSTAPELISISEIKIPSELVNETEKQIVDDLKTEEVKLPETKPNQNELIGDHGDLLKQTVEPIVAANENNKDATNTPIEIDQQPKETVEAIVVPLTAEEPSDKTATNLTDDNTKPTAESEESSQVSKLKENGIGENHAAETSATESLNGQVEHKTIGELKSDCSEKLKSEPTTETAAGTVKVTE